MSKLPNSHIDDELLVRYLSKDTSVEENKLIEIWLDSDEKNFTYFNELKLLWQVSASAKKADNINTQADWQKVQQKISVQADEKYVHLPSRSDSFWNTWRKVAAAIILLAGCYFVWFSYTSSEQVEMMTITTTNQMSTVTLPDGSKVDLNRNSRLIYPKVFDGESRSVELEGEAFFDVVKNPDSPFMITTGKAVTRVLGTSFNVDARTSQDVAVTVYSGRVALFDKNTPNEQVELTIGKQGILSEAEGLVISDNGDPNLIAWKTGVLTFENTPITKVVNDLMNFYGRSIQLEQQSLINCRFTATYDNATLKEVLTELKLVLPINIEKSNKTIKIKGSGC